MPIEDIVFFSLAVLAAFGLGYFFGCARATSKYNRKRRGLREQIGMLENQVEMLKRLNPKLKRGEDEPEKKGDYLPGQIKGLKVPVKSVKDIEDEDTKTAELEIK